MQKPVYSDFLCRADAFVSRCMGEYRPVRFSQSKVIHDCVWGTVMFYPWELTVIDSPLLQRLRRINQLGLAMLTYPSAHHSRFEHTLGVVAVVSQMISSVNREDNALGTDTKAPLSPADVRRLRLAALLHDVGHCFFSHLSESIYGAYPETAALKAEIEDFSGAQPHEMFAYIIINTPTFRRFFAESGYPFDGEDPDLILSDVAKMIVGAPIEVRGGIRPAYLTEMINGQFDADALDYLRRDSYATGLALTYHIDRFLYKLRIADRVGEDGIPERHLTVPVSGISTVEEMVFSKLMLTRYIYQHQKVLAVESMMGDLVDGMRRGGKLSHPCDFLEFTDNDIFSLGTPHDSAMRPAAAEWKVSEHSNVTVGDLARSISLRRVPKKAIVLNIGNVEMIDGERTFSAAALAAKLRSIEGLREKISAEAARLAEKAGLPVPELYDICIAVPKVNMAKNFSRTPVLTYDGSFIPMSDAVDLNDWAASFGANSYNAYVFARPEMLPAVSLAAISVLERCGIVCLRDRIFSGLKESAVIEETAKRLGIKFNEIRNYI